MLQNLHITHYALIDQLDIDFSNGYSVITGETGAGKSIILGALGLLLGQRADAKAIKTGATKCCVEGRFLIEGLQLNQLFTDLDIDFDGNECIVRREITTAGKSRAFVNDTPVSLAHLKSITSRIIDIHSQHQNLLMGQEHFLLDTLDTIGHDEKQHSAYIEIYRQWNEARKELQKLQEQADKDRSDLDYMQFQLQQIDDTHLQEDEQEALEEESDTLGHAEEIKSALYQASSSLTADEQNPISTLKTNSTLLQSISNVFAPAAALAERIESARIELKDIADELEQALEKVDFDPERLSYVDDRLSEIYSLQKKHHVDTIAELLRIADELRDKIDKIENIDDHIARQSAAVESLHSQMLEKGHALTDTRKAAGEKIAKELLVTLQSLGMPATRLHFEITERQQPDSSGLDNVAFLFSANKNMAEQDVAQIASGGEIARLMLSLKALLSKHRNLPTIIFDEIDTGVSGTIAEKMANVMQQMAESCQVLCITHLPQIAALGRNHYRVYKSETADGTSSHISLLTTDERIREIANMLSGAEMTDAAINNAKSLLKL